MFYEPMAHITEEGRAHPLREHLLQTAERAAQFASVFGFRQWGRLGGLWHDLGKYGPAFQRKLMAAAGAEAHLEARARVDHSTAGAIHAIERFSLAGRVFAYVIAGHHAGLPDWEADRTGKAALSQRLLDGELLRAAIAGGAPLEILDQPMPTEKPIGRDPAFWLRMLFSCIVDADFLDTEDFFEPEKAALRTGYPALSELLAPFNRYMEMKQTDAPDTKVNRIRSRH